MAHMLACLPPTQVITANMSIHEGLSNVLTKSERVEGEVLQEWLAHVQVGGYTALMFHRVLLLCARLGHMHGPPSLNTRSVAALLWGSPHLPTRPPTPAMCRCPTACATGCCWGSCPGRCCWSSRCAVSRIWRWLPPAASGSWRAPLRPRCLRPRPAAAAFDCAHCGIAGAHTPSQQPKIITALNTEVFVSLVCVRTGAARCCLLATGCAFRVSCCRQLLLLPSEWRGWCCPLLGTQKRREGVMLCVLYHQYDESLPKSVALLKFAPCGE